MTTASPITAGMSFIAQVIDPAMQEAVAFGGIVLGASIGAIGSVSRSALGGSAIISQLSMTELSLVIDRNGETPARAGTSVVVVDRVPVGYQPLAQTKPTQAPAHASRGLLGADAGARPMLDGAGRFISYRG